MRPGVQWQLSEGGVAVPWDISELDDYGVPWAYYDHSDLSALWQDVGGTVPVTADGQSVARRDDKSGNGYHFTQSDSAKRPKYRTDGTYHWLEYDGANDHLIGPANANFDADVWTAIVGYKVNSTAVTGYLIGFNWSSGGTSSDAGFQLFQSGSGKISALARTSAGAAVLSEAAGTTSKAVFAGKWRADNKVEGFLNKVSAGATSGATMSPSGHVRTVEGVDQRDFAGGELNGNVYAMVLIRADLSSWDFSKAQDWVNDRVGAY